MILNEKFDENKLGWPEEFTASHQVFMHNGYYNIISIDTSKYRSSTYSWEDGYLINLPEEYVISTSIDLKKRSNKERDITNFGILLNSSSLEYEFSVYWHGLVMVTELDNNTEERKTLFENHNKEIVSPIQLEIKIKNQDFELFINGQLEGSGRFKNRTTFWQNLRLYTTAGSSVAIDYLKISKP